MVTIQPYQREVGGPIKGRSEYDRGDEAWGGSVLGFEQIVREVVGGEGLSE